MLSLKTINFDVLFLLCALCMSGNVHALSMPTGEIAKTRARVLQGLPQKQKRWETFAGKRGPGSSKIFDIVYKQTRECKKDEIFLYSDLRDDLYSGSENEFLNNIGICISKNLVKFSKTISHELYNATIRGAHYAENQENIKFGIPCSIAEIRDAVDILQEINKNWQPTAGRATGKKVDKAILDKVIKPEILNSFNRLVGVTSIFDYLGCPLDIEGDLLPEIKVMMNDGKQNIVNNKTFHQLPEKYQDLLIADPLKRLLKEAIPSRRFVVAEDNGPASVSDDGRKMVFLAENNKAIKLYVSNQEGDWIGERSFTSGDNSYSCVTISSDGNKIVSATNKHIVIIDISDLSVSPLPIKEINYPNTIKSIISSKDGKKIIIKDEIGKIDLWSIADTNEIASVSIVQEGLNIVQLLANPECNKIVVADRNKNIFCLNIDDLGSNKFLRNVFKLELGDPLKNIIISPDGMSIVFWTVTNKMIIAHQSQGGLVQFPMIGHKNNINDVAFSPDNNYIASVGDDGIILWNKNGQILCRTSKETIFSEEFSTVVFGSDSKKLLVWSKGEDLYINAENRLVCYDIGEICNNAGEPISPEFTVGVGPRAVKLSKLFFSKDDRKIILSGTPSVILTLLTDSDVSILRKIDKCTIEQRRLIYQLAKEFRDHDELIEPKKGSVERTIFRTLSPDIQKALDDWFTENLTVMRFRPGDFRRQR